MAAAVTIKDTDKGYKALVARLYGFARPRIDVGILEAEGGKPEVDSAMTVLEVAIINEFGGIDANGNEHPPARSFIRAWFDEREASLRQDLTVLMQSVVKGARTKEEILELLGQRCVGQIQSRIADGVPPPNRPSTIRKKGSSTPLVDHGTLRSSITYRVDNG